MNRKMLSALLCVACTACTDTPTGPGTDPGTNRAIASWIAGGSSSTVFFTSGGPDGDFEHTAACALGGSITHKWSGTFVKENDIYKTTSKGTIKHDACIAEFPGPNGVLRFSMTSQIEVEGETHTQLPAEGERPVFLYSRTRQKGHVSTTQNGRTASCEMDFVSEFEASKHVRTLKGVYCGRTLDVVIPAMR